MGRHLCSQLAFPDAVRDAGDSSRAVGAPIVAHPDFERLETEGGSPSPNDSLV